MLRQIRVAVSSAIVLAMASTIGATAQTTGDVIAIGYTGPLSGGAAAYGTDVQHGLQLAIDEINAGGGISVGGKKSTFKLVSLDDQYRPNEAATNAKRLVSQDGAKIVFCPHSGGILAIMGFNDKQSPKFLVGGYSSEPAILKQNNNATLMIPPAYDSYFKPYIGAEMKRFGKKLGLLATTTAYGKAWSDGFKKAWEAAGGTVVGDFGVDYNTTTDFSGSVTKALDAKPDVMLVGGPSQPTGLVIKAARNQGFKGGFAMMDQAKFEQVEDAATIAQLDGTVGVSPFRGFSGAGVNSFIAEYTKKYGDKRAPNSEVGLNYEAMHLFAQAIAKAGSTDPGAVMGKMTEAAKTLPGKYQVGKLNGISKAGHMLIDALAAEVQNGKYVQLRVPFTE
ncbi:MAG: ABC transporter substrate-binding protein [Candidatus Elarobacter sp.]